MTMTETKAPQSGNALEITQQEKLATRAAQKQAEKEAALQAHAEAPVRIGLPRHADMPEAIEKKMELAEYFAKSGLCPDGYREKVPDRIKAGYTSNVFAIFVALQFGSELGLAPWASLRGIAVINGKPSAEFQTQLGICMSTGLLEDNWSEETDADGGTVTYYVKRRGKQRVYSGKFSMSQARSVGLTNKDNWKNYPKDMLRARAGVRALKEAFPEILQGLPTPDEASDYDVVTTATVVEPGAPAQIGRRSDWRMDAQKFVDAKSILVAKKVPTAARNEIVSKATGGRILEEVDGVPQFTEQEYAAIRAAALAWQPQTPTASAAPIEDHAAAGIAAARRFTAEERALREGFPDLAPGQREPEPSAEPTPRKSSLTPETLKALEARVATLHGPNANVAAVVDEALGNAGIDSIDDVSEAIALKALPILDERVLAKRRAEKK